MHLKLPVVLLSALALVAPAAGVSAKDKGKHKNKDNKEQKSDDRSGDRRDDDHDRDRDRDGDRDRDHDRDRSGNGNKITICHIPPGNPANRKTLSVGESAWSAHSGHGDYRGACRTGGGNPGGSRFDQLDTNKDGVLSRNEWVGDRATFDRLDTNDDGVISRAEYRR